MFKKYVYLMLNKPKGYISATEDRSCPTVLDLIDEELLERDKTTALIHIYLPLEESPLEAISFLEE